MKAVHGSFISRRGFTLIELLVVVAIIALLIAILQPSLRRANESARIVRCGSNEHQVGLSLRMYGTDNRNKMPPGNATSWPGLGIDATWSNKNIIGADPVNWPKYVSAPGQPMGVGFLFTNNYIIDIPVFYCPSWTHPYFQPDKLDAIGYDGGGTRNAYGGVPYRGKVWPDWFAGISYMYRSTFGLETQPLPGLCVPGGKPPDAYMGSNTAVLADHWSFRELSYTTLTHYIGGQNSLYLDGHVSWVGDPDNTYMLARTFYTSHGCWPFQETIWIDHFDKK